MTKAMKKDFGREVRYSLGRYLSVFLIVVLGVSFFSGIKTAAPAMRASADALYDDTAFMDICVSGTLGVTEKDVAEIKKIAGIADAEGTYTADFLCASEQAELVTTVLSLTDRINLVKVSEGRYPEKYNECIVDSLFIEKSGYKLGDTIRLTTGNDNDLEDTLVTDEFTIVGVGTSPYYLSDERGMSSIGSGVVDAFIVVPKKAFSLSCYSQILVSVQGAKELNCFSGKYDRLIERLQSNIESIAETRSSIRYEEFKSESVKGITAEERKFEEKRERAMNQFTEAYQELSDAESALSIAQTEIDTRKQEISDAQELLDMQEGSLDENKAQVEQAKKNLADLQVRYNNYKAQLDQANEIIAKMEKELQQSAGGMTTDEYAQYAFTVYSYKATAQVYQSQLNAIKLGMDQAQAQINSAESIIEGSPDAIAEARQKLAEGDTAVVEAQRALAEKQAQLDRAKEEYEFSKDDVIEELQNAERKLNNYKEKIENTAVPVWYVTGREAVSTYSSLKGDADGISAIGLVFPVIFFIVAALVSLTTMTRMVEEQRTQIGTMKALGYSKKEITSKYVLYALTASLAGGIIGIIIGEATIPKLIVNTYRLVYVNLTKTAVSFNIPYAVIALVIAVVCTSGAAFAACYKSLKEEPSSLMRPEAPKAGKKIFLEKIDGFWLRLNFSQKAAWRNMLRYKKRLFMTLFGVAGCMALLLVGFGIRDSVSSMTEKQFNGIWNYQGTVTVDESLSRTDIRHTLSELKDTDGVDDFLQVHREYSFACFEGNEQNTYILVPQDLDFLYDYITLETRFGHKACTLDDNSVVITEKLAKTLGVHVGDTVTFKSEKDGIETGGLTVAGITENYIYNYVYMTPMAYESQFNEAALVNTLLLRSSAEDDNELARSILQLNGVTSVTMNSKIQQQVDETAQNLIVIVVIMILSAGLLAFVVLYNLNNINITERRRELATLKVLGFYDDELEKYVFRENVILTVFGMIIGVAAGVILHFFVMRSVETDSMMFGRQIGWYSYILSIVLTAAFSVLVNFIMSFKLKKIDMVESLKNVE